MHIGRAELADFWHPVAWTSEIGYRPYATQLLDEPLVLWRNDEGDLKCARDRCPHRGTALSLGEVVAGSLVCPYHGWSFGEGGLCNQMPQLAAGSTIPSRAQVPTYRVEEHYGIAWVCLGDPVEPVPDFPEWDDPAYRHVPCAAYTWETSAARMVENFTDFGHLGYLHDGLLGSKDDLVVPEHHVSTEGRKLHYEISMEVPNTNDQFAVTDVSGSRGIQTNTYVLTLPHAIWLRCTYEDTGAHRTLFFCVQPRSDDVCTGYCYQSRDFDLGGDDEPYARFQELLAEQDRPIVESQRPKELPLERIGELHLGFDRVAIAYRRALSGINDISRSAALSHSGSGTI